MRGAEAERVRAEVRVARRYDDDAPKRALFREAAVAAAHRAGASCWRELERENAGDARALAGDAVLRAAVERWLQVATEACMDVAYHVVAAAGWTPPESGGAAFAVLAASWIAAPYAEGRRANKVDLLARGSFDEMCDDARMRLQAWVALLVCGCRAPAGAGEGRAMIDASVAAAPVAAAANDASVDAAATGPCTARTCDLTREACCDDLRTHEHRCLPKSEAARGDIHCGLGDEWAFVAECAGFADCAAGQACCTSTLQLLLPGAPDPGKYLAGDPSRMEYFCDSDCGSHEVCRAGGACKGYWGCAPRPDLLPGGYCSGAPARPKPPFVAATKVDAGSSGSWSCPDDYMLGMDDAGWCGLICQSDADCGGASCMNDHMHGEEHCQK